LQSKFAQAELIKSVWKREGLDPLFEAYLKAGKLNVAADGKMTLDIVNGHKLHWMAAGPNKHGGMDPEFIGMVGKDSAKVFDADDARVIIAASKSRGWGSVQLRGATQHKEMMWLEA